MQGCRGSAGVQALGGSCVLSSCRCCQGSLAPLQGCLQSRRLPGRALSSSMSFLCRAWGHRDSVQCWAAVPGLALVLLAEMPAGCPRESPLGDSKGQRDGEGGRQDGEGESFAAQRALGGFTEEERGALVPCNPIALGAVRAQPCWLRLSSLHSHEV